MVLFSTRTLIIFFLYANVYGSEAPEWVKEIVEDNGYTYLQKASAISTLEKGKYALRVFIRENALDQYKSVFVLVTNDSVIELDKPVWAGGGVNIDIIDLDNDGYKDIVASEQYEPNLLVRVFLNNDNKSFKKALQEYSSSKPKFVDLITTNNTKELILTEDVYGYYFDELFMRYLYFLDEEEYKLLDPTKNRSR